MKVARLAVVIFLLAATSLLLAIEIAALLPRVDVARMLLAAGGSIVGGFIGVGAIGAWFGLTVAYLLRANTPRLARMAIGMSAVLVLAAAANVTVWLSGLDRRDIEFRSGDVQLKGTLMAPNGTARPPVAIIVHGSAPLPRDFYAVWGRHLVREGVAVFVYDKRGTGESGGEIPRDNGTIEYLSQLGRDAAAAVAAIQSRADVDLGRISLIGISQGGWVVPVALAERQGVFRAAYLSGPVATTNEEGAFSDAAGDGGSGPDNDAAIDAGNRAALAAPRGGFDPMRYLQQSSVPGRWFFADGDRSIPVALSRTRVDALRAAGKDAQSVVLPRTDHVLLDHTILPLGFSPLLMPALAAWLRGEG